MGDVGQPSLLARIMEFVGILDGLRRRRKSDGASGSGGATAAQHLEGFISSRRGIEAWVEQPTTLTGPTLLLIAYDGEWTRRSVPSPAWARKCAHSHQLPCYDAGVVAYPQRMRDYNSRAKKRPGAAQP
jgi:hypothetical protein